MQPRDAVLGPGGIRSWAGFLCQPSVLGLLALLALMGSRAEAVEVEPRHKIDEVRIESEPGWFVIKVPTQASWAHWTLANPPRIILDFADALSLLPEAPALYEVQLDRGPVKIFRTSQFANNPLDRRVRMTLELNKITPYEARRVGNEIHVLVEADGLNEPAAVLTADGLHLEGAGSGVASLTDAAAQAFQRPSENRDSAEAATASGKATKAETADRRDTPKTPDKNATQAARTPDAADKAESKAVADAADHSAEEASEEAAGDASEDAAGDAARSPAEERNLTLAERLAAKFGTEPVVSKDPDPAEGTQREVADAPGDETPEVAADVASDLDATEPAKPAKGDAAEIKDETDDFVEADDDMWRSDPGVMIPRDDLADHSESGADGPPSTTGGTADAAAGDEGKTSDQGGDDLADGSADESADDVADDAADDVDDDAADEDPSSQADQASSDPDGESEGDKLESMRKTLEQLLGGNNVEDVTGEDDRQPAEDDALATDLSDGEDDFEDWQDFEEDQELEPADSLRARRARHLLEGAIEDWLVSDIEGAERRAERCLRYYGDYPAGRQAGLLLHEIYMTTDRAGKTASLYLMGEKPDTDYLGLDFFEKLLEIYFSKGDRESVVERMEHWGPLYEDTGWRARYHYAFGREDFLARRVERAELHLKKVGPKDPGGAEALLMRARLADETERGLEALGLYRELARSVTGPFSLRGLARAADLEFQFGEIEASLDAYEEILAVNAPADEKVWARYQIGNCHFIKGRVEEARRAYEELIQKHPQAFWTRFARERLGSLGWESDVASRIEELKNP